MILEMPFQHGILYFHAIFHIQCSKDIPEGPRTRPSRSTKAPLLPQQCQNKVREKEALELWTNWKKNKESLLKNLKSLNSVKNTESTGLRRTENSGYEILFSEIQTLASAECTSRSLKSARGCTKTGKYSPT